MIVEMVWANFLMLLGSAFALIGLIAWRNDKGASPQHSILVGVVIVMNGLGVMLNVIADAVLR